MVFRIKAELTEEDRAAWRRLAASRDQALRRKCQAAVWEWVKDKLPILPGMAFCIAGLYAVSLGRGPLLKRISVGVFSLLFLLAGVLAFVARPYPAKRSEHLPIWDFPPTAMLDIPVRAAFFGDGCFVFRASGEKIRLGYSTITGAWEDGGRFYLFFADRPPLVLPKRGLDRWMPEDFRDFLERELEVPVERMK